MKFNDMPYTRPEMDALKSQAKDIITRFKAADSFAVADKCFREFDDFSHHYETAYSIVYIRHTINTKDEFYDAENDYMDENMPVVEEIQQEMFKAMYDSKFRPDFENKYGALMFKNMEMQIKSFCAENIQDMQEENRLISEYDKLIADAQIPFEDGVYTLSQMSPFKTDVNDERRLAAWIADGQFFTDNGERLDEIYDAMVKVRTRMAERMGYKNFVELGYYRMTRNCYNADDVKKFREAVIKHIVPIADALYREQAERTGLGYPLSYANASMAFRSGNPKPTGTPDEILAHGKRFYHELSPETAQFIDYMFENELFDVISRKSKVGGGYCTGLPDYKSPFIFANFNGTQHDVEVITHEAGHAFAGYTAYRMDVPSVLDSPTVEGCEVHSMSMEFFAWPWEKGFFGADTEKFYYSHLSGALMFIPYGTMVDHFQHIVYENPKLTPKERHAEWAKLQAIYMPWIKLDGQIPFYSMGKAWQRQSHIYEVPFYYIDYCLAQTVALEFWAAMQRDQKDAWQRYLKYVNLAGTRTFTELVNAAGLDSPFGDAALKRIADEANAWLAACDKSTLK